MGTLWEPIRRFCRLIYFICRPGCRLSAPAPSPIGSASLFPSPALGERYHRSLARRLVAVDWCAIFVVAVGQRPQPWLAPRRGRGPALCLERSLRAPALWRSGEVKVDRLSASTRARLGGELSGAGLQDQRRDLLGAVDADPGAEHPAAPAVATLLVRCQPEALAHHASTLASGAAAAPFMMRPTTFLSHHVIIIVTPLAEQAGSRGAFKD